MTPPGQPPWPPVPTPGPASKVELEGSCQSWMPCAHSVPFSMYDLFHYFEILVTFWTRGPPSASCLCCTHDKQGQGQQSGRHTDHHRLKVAGLKSSSRKIIEDAEEGSPRRPSCCRPARDSPANSYYIPEARKQFWRCPEAQGR